MTTYVFYYYTDMVAWYGVLSNFNP